MRPLQRSSCLPAACLPCPEGNTLLNSDMNLSALLHLTDLSAWHRYFSGATWAGHLSDMTINTRASTWGLFCRMWCPNCMLYRCLAVLLVLLLQALWNSWKTCLPHWGHQCVCSACTHSRQLLVKKHRSVQCNSCQESTAKLAYANRRHFRA